MMAQPHWSRLWLRCPRARAGVRACVCVCSGDFLSTLCANRAPPRTIKTTASWESQRFSWERSHTSTTIIISVSSTLRLRSRRLHQALTSTTARLSRLTRGITVSQYLQKPLLIPSFSDCSSRKAGVSLVHAGLLSVNKINFSSVEEDVSFYQELRNIPPDSF